MDSAKNSDCNEDLNNIAPADLVDAPSSQESDDGVACSTDAGHPRMTASCRLAEADLNSFYCETCDIHFMPKKLQEHFTNHRSDEKCYYCSKAVFTYTVKKSKEVVKYHACKNKEAEGSSSPVLPDMNMNL